MHDDFDYTQEPWQAFMSLIFLEASRNGPWKFSKFSERAKPDDPLRLLANSEVGQRHLRNLRLCYGNLCIEKVYNSLIAYTDTSGGTFSIRTEDGTYIVTFRGGKPIITSDQILVDSKTLTPEQIAFLAKKIIAFVKDAGPNGCSWLYAQTIARERHVVLAGGLNRFPSWNPVKEAVLKATPGIVITGKGTKERAKIDPTIEQDGGIQVAYEKRERSVTLAKGPRKGTTIVTVIYPDGKTISNTVSTTFLTQSTSPLQKLLSFLGE